MKVGVGVPELKHGTKILVALALQPGKGESQGILLMVQKSGGHQLVDSLSHDLQGFIHPNGGWLGYLNHRQYVTISFGSVAHAYRSGYLLVQCERRRLQFFLHQAMMFGLCQIASPSNVYPQKSATKKALIIQGNHWLMSP